MAARLRAIREAGEPVTLAELAATYPPLPTDRNGAKFLSEAFDLMEKTWGRPHGPRRYSLNLVEMPKPWEPLPADDLNAIAQFLANKQGVFRLIENGLDVGQCRFEIDFARLPTKWYPLHLIPLKHAVAMLGLQAAEAIEGNDAVRAAALVRTGIGLAECLRTEPLLISQRVRLGCHRTMLEQVERWMCRCQPSPSDMKDIQDLLTRTIDTEAMARAYVTMRCVGIHFYQHYLLYRGPEDRRGELFPSGHENDPHALVTRFAPRAFHGQDMCTFLDTIERYIAAMRLPYPESLLEVDALRGLAPSPLRTLMPSYSVSPSHHRVERLLEEISRVECARMALAIERFRSQNDRLPTVLREVVPGFAKHVATDPFCGATLRYRTKASGFGVYSVGQNRRGDRGVEDAKSYYAKDIVFEVSRPVTGQAAQ